MSETVDCSHARCDRFARWNTEQATKMRAAIAGLTNKSDGLLMLSLSSRPPLSQMKRAVHVPMGLWLDGKTADFDRRHHPRYPTGRKPPHDNRLCSF